MQVCRSVHACLFRRARSAAAAAVVGRTWDDHAQCGSVLVKYTDSWPIKQTRACEFRVNARKWVFLKRARLAFTTHVARNKLLSLTNDTEANQALPDHVRAVNLYPYRDPLTKRKKIGATLVRAESRWVWPIAYEKMTVSPSGVEETRLNAGKQAFLYRTVSLGFASNQYLHDMNELLSKQNMLLKSAKQQFDEHAKTQSAASKDLDSTLALALQARSDYLHVLRKLVSKAEFASFEAALQRLPRNTLKALGNSNPELDERKDDVNSKTEEENTQQVEQEEDEYGDRMDDYGEDEDDYGRKQYEDDGDDYTQPAQKNTRE